MRNILLVGWLLLPIGAWAYHEGPGQDRVALEEADAVLLAAHEAAADGHRLDALAEAEADADRREVLEAAADAHWHTAVAKYEEALGELPKNPDAVDAKVTQRMQIELNKARMKASGLPTARAELDSLVEQMQADAKTDPVLLRDARQALARAQFFTTWLMRLEGLDREAWEPEIEAARQNWRLLAEQAGDPEEAEVHKGDLEAAVQLARLEIEDLQGLPLPSE